MMLTLAEENYLKAIYHLERAIHGMSGSSPAVVGTGLLAESMGVQAPTATDMVRKLAEKDFVTYEKSKGASLTDGGRQIAVQVIRRHRIWETFLARTLGFDWSQVHDLAEQLEHIQSEELIDRLEQHLGYPSVDPHGDPIPDAQGRVNAPPTVALASATVGATYLMAGITDHSGPFLHYLDKLGLGIGKRIEVLHREEFDNSLTVRIGDQPAVVIGAKAGATIQVLEA